MQTLEVITYGRSQKIHTEPLRRGLQGNLQTLRYMAEMVRRDAHDSGIENFVKGTVLANVPPHDDMAEMDACFRFVRSIAWRADAVDKERIADTRSTLALKPAPWGDCGDKSIMLASFFAIIGHTPYFVCMSQTPVVDAKDFEFDHVYVGVRHKGKHFPFDPTPEQAPAGWQAPAYVRVMVDFWDGKLKLVRLP